MAVVFLKTIYISFRRRALYKKIGNIKNFKYKVNCISVRFDWACVCRYGNSIKAAGWPCSFLRLYLSALEGEHNINRWENI